MQNTSPAFTGKSKMKRLVLTLVLGVLASQAHANQNFYNLAKQCAPNVHPQTMAAIVRTESSFNPFAIGVVGGALSRQPRNMQEAQRAVQTLLSQGKNFSMGLGQVNRYNLPKYGLNYQSVFDPCKNLNAGGKILAECYARALPSTNGNQQLAVKKAFSCYYSGNFVTGYKHGYVQKVVNNSGARAMQAMNIYVPAVGTYTAEPYAPNNTQNTPDYRQDPKPANGNDGAYRLQPQQQQAPQKPTTFAF